MSSIGYERIRDNRAELGVEEANPEDGNRTLSEGSRKHLTANWLPHQTLPDSKIVRLQSKEGVVRKDAGRGQNRKTIWQQIKRLVCNFVIFIKYNIIKLIARKLVSNNPDGQCFEMVGVNNKN